MATQDGNTRKKGPTVIAKGEVKVWSIMCTGDGGHPRHPNEHGNYLPNTGCGAKLQVSIDDLFKMKRRVVEMFDLGSETFDLCFECPVDYCHSITRIPEEDVRTLDRHKFKSFQEWKYGTMSN